MALSCLSQHHTHTHTVRTCRTEYMRTHTQNTYYVYRESNPNLYYSISSTKETLYKPREIHIIFFKAKYTLLLTPPIALGSYTQK